MMEDKKMNQKEKQIVLQMKKEMEFLKQYTQELRIHSALYSNNSSSLQIEDDVVDYLHYTKSIIHVSNDQQNHYEPVLKAMERMDYVNNKKNERHLHAYVLLQIIMQLPVLEKELLLDLYVRNLNKKVILLHQGDIVESTLYRRLQRALLRAHKLYQTLEIID